MIKVEQVNKTFDGFQALTDASLHVEKGSVYGLVGPNGAGKSTLLRHITGVYRPDSGEVLVDGEPVYENAAVKGRMAYIPDQLFYFMQANTLDMKKFYAGLYPNFDNELFEKMRVLFPAVNVKKNIRHLSKGMRKQVVFWLSICCKPDVLILDEPVDGLDPVMRRQIWGVLLQQTAERDMTVLVSSHNLRELEDVCDHVGIIHNGRIVLEKSLEDLQGSVVKIQVGMKEDEPVLPPGMEVLHTSNLGHVYTLIVRGDAETAKEFLLAQSALFVDVLPLSLEEIFIYEMGGMNYEIKDILV